MEYEKQIGTVNGGLKAVKKLKLYELLQGVLLTKIMSNR